MISSISTLFNNNNKKIIDYLEEEESISLDDITRVDFEIIAELEELYEDYEEEEEDNDNDNDSIYEEKEDLI